MIKLTRLNQHVVAINPDHIRWADESPDTTLFMFGGERILVRESLDELMDKVVEFRARIRARIPADAGVTTPDDVSGDLPRAASIVPPNERISARPARISSIPPRMGGR